MVQPRKGQSQHPLYHDVYNAVAHGKYIESVRSQLVKDLNSGNSILISEEMFTVSSYNVSWRDKLYNISRLVEGIQYEIIATVREPVTAIFSFYVELYQRFSKRWDRFIDCALHDEDMEIFHYGKLLKNLFDNFEINKVHIFAFEDIISCKLKEFESLFGDISQIEVNKHISHHNQRIEAEDNFVVSKYEISIIDSIYKNFEWLRMSDAKYVTLMKEFAKPAVQFIDKISKKKLKVQRPPDSVLFFLRESLSAETNALDKEFGIKYDVK